MTAERETIARRVEAEEEYLTNTLSKRLETVMAEKKALEMRLAQLNLHPVAAATANTSATHTAAATTVRTTPTKDP